MSYFEYWALALLSEAPGHVGAVRRFVFDGLDPDEVTQLAHVCDGILDRIDTHPQG